MAEPGERGVGGKKTLPPETETVLEFASKHPKVFQVISEEIAERQEATRAARASAPHRQKLLGYYQSYTDKASFAVGDLVTWKPGMKNRVYPEYSEPAVVMEVLATPERADRNPSSAYFRESLDIALGLLDGDGDFLIFHFDSSRFRHLDPSDEGDVDA